MNVRMFRTFLAIVTAWSMIGATCGVQAQVPNTSTHCAGKFDTGHDKSPNSHGDKAPCTVFCGVDFPNSIEFSEPAIVAALHLPGPYWASSGFVLGVEPPPPR